MSGTPECELGSHRSVYHAWAGPPNPSYAVVNERSRVMLTNWLDEIVNYFAERRSSGFVEGLNNKIKTLKRRCYGISRVTTLFQRLYLDLEGYRRFA